MTWSLGLTVLALHVVAGGAVVGGQLLVSVAALRAVPAEPGPLTAFERFYRIYALIVVLVAAGAGAWLLKYTLISSLMLVSTPYGPALVGKVGGTLALLLYLLICPRLLSGGPEAPGGVARRIWALVGAGLVIGVAGISTSMRYL